MTPIDYDAEIETFMKALGAYGIAAAGDHTAAWSHLSDCGAPFDRGSSADKVATGIVSGLYLRALTRVRELEDRESARTNSNAVQLGECFAAIMDRRDLWGEVNDAIEALAACHNDRRVIVYHYDVDWRCAVPGPDGRFFGESSYGDNPIDAIMAAVRLMRAEDKRAAGDNAP